jgi:hypothetical protein
MSEILTTQETVRLCELERIIQKNKDGFVECGMALEEVRDSKMYRATFKTFEDYCEKRWGFSKRSAYQFIAAAQVVENVRHGAQALPSTERQARPLAKLPAAEQPAAWTKAQEKAKDEGKPVTARHVEEAVAEAIEAVVVDGTKDDDKPARKPPVKVIESEGMRIWSLAKGHLDRINKHDEYREKALTACIEYCQKRIESNK